MKFRYIVFLITLLLQAINTSLFSQNENIQLVLMDSIVLQHPDDVALKGLISKEGDTFKFIDAISCEVFKFDLDGNFTKRLNVKHYLEQQDIPIARLTGFTEMNSGYITYESVHEKFYHLNSAFQTLGPKKLSAKFKGINYRLKTDDALFGYKYDAKRNFALLPLKPYKWKGLRNDKKYLKGGAKFYNTPGLVGLFNPEGKCIGTFGTFDQIYRDKKYLMYLDDFSYFYSEKKSLLFISQKATSNIQAYDLTNNKAIGLFGNPGKYIKVIPDSLKVINNYHDQEYFDKSTRLVIESPEYNSVYYHDSLNLVFRFYRTSVKDTTVVDSAYVKLLAKFEKEKIKACPAPSRQAINQKEIYRSKPDYLQIYSGANNYELVYDEPFPFKPLNIIGQEGKDIFIRRAKRGDDPKSVIIYKFRIELQ